MSTEALSPLPLFSATSLPVSGVILAGGAARRMGGRGEADCPVDKGLLPLAGQPLAWHVAARLRPQVRELLVSANRHAAEYARLGVPVVADAVPDYAGPLAGLHAALGVAREEWLVSAPCDVPGLPSDLVARLHTACTAAGAQAAVVRTAGRLQPVFCLCHTSLRASLERFLASGERRVRLWLDQVGAVVVDFDTAVDAEAFRNINTPEDLAELEEELRNTQT